MEKDFEEVFSKMCVEDPKEASLLALSRALLRNIDEKSKDYYENIKSTLLKVQNKNLEVNKLIELFKVIDDNDKKMISCLKDVELLIASYLQKAYNNKNDKVNNNVECCKNNNKKLSDQRKNIKKWWE